MTNGYHIQPKTAELDVVRIVSIKNGAILLVQESDDPNWKLPGGKIHKDETIFEAFQRELLEELGSTFEEDVIIRYFPAKIPDSENIRHILLVKTIEDAEIEKTTEVAKAKYFELSKLPETKFKPHILTAVSLVGG